MDFDGRTYLWMRKDFTRVREEERKRGIGGRDSAFLFSEPVGVIKASWFGVAMFSEVREDAVNGDKVDPFYDLEGSPGMGRLVERKMALVVAGVDASWYSDEWVDAMVEHHDWLSPYVYRIKNNILPVSLQYQALE